MNHFFIILVLSASAAPAGTAYVHGLKMYYEVHGEGHPVVLLHGGTATIQLSFSKQIELLAQHHRVITIEQMGHGHTPDIAGRPFRYEDMAEDTAALLESIGVTQTDLVGWSDGGQVALRLASTHPDLVRRVLASGVGFGASPASRQSVETMSDTRWPHEFRDDYIRTSPDGAGHWPIVWRKACMMWARPTWGFTAADLHQIKARALIIAGDHDIVSAEVTRQVAAAIPHGAYRILPNTTHWTFQTRPDLMNPLLLEFLDGE